MVAPEFRPRVMFIMELLRPVVSSDLFVLCHNKNLVSYILSIYQVKTGRWAGVVAAFITMSDAKDEIDWEFPGTCTFGRARIVNIFTSVVSPRQVLRQHKDRPTFTGSACQTVRA